MYVVADAYPRVVVAGADTGVNRPAA